MPNPNYGNLGDHTETIEIDFDPSRISYSDLLNIFWKSHDPTARTWRRQYMNAVFYRNESQHREAAASKAAVEKEIGSRVRTEILPIESFTRAEAYHQKYLLSSHSILTGELSAIYTDRKAFTDATSAARINGYAGGYGTPSQLMHEIDSLGLSPEGKSYLLKIVR